MSPHEHVDVRNDSGLPDHDSLEERINRAEHDAGRPIGGVGQRSHCWLCRRDDEAAHGRRDHHATPAVKEKP